MRPRFVFAVSTFALLATLIYSATVGYFEPDTSHYAVIDDVTRMKHIGPAYCLVSVDDGPVQRRRGRFVTMVPLALVAPGDRRLQLQLDRDDPESRVTINAKLEQGVRYQLRLDNEIVRLVEDQR
ncbi:hypothetical protein Pla52o_55050 [Novipirellula galeiformis]|uniref:Uncharacterized protein n=2 Tax=Novipirellula galeiformis TaxID=2528004 RepID=A0A5C6BXY0_9BACT|nr:hypothetical protein Pla52o_55020 [Novipirellula galeiformis]TWU17166.1 hypothetical protein Pla52o_55050 [Novipirellula galeiformis]